MCMRINDFKICPNGCMYTWVGQTIIVIVMVTSAHRDNTYRISHIPNQQNNSFHELRHITGSHVVQTITQQLS